MAISTLFTTFLLPLCEITPSKLVHRGWLLQVVRRGSDIFGATPHPHNIGRDVMDVMDVMEAMETPVSQRVGTCWEQADIIDLRGPARASLLRRLRVGEDSEENRSLNWVIPTSMM